MIQENGKKKVKIHLSSACSVSRKKYTINNQALNIKLIQCKYMNANLKF